MMIKKVAKFLLIIFTITNTAIASEDIEKPKQMDWAFDGVTGKFDYESIQRGFKVYKEVCSACHSVKYLHFRNLEDIGFSVAQVKSLAAQYDITDGPNKEGQMYKRPGTPPDAIPGPFANPQEARFANNGGLPPDLSLIIKAREDGANYVYSLLTGYTTAPADFVVGENMHYNTFFAGGGKQFLMPPPLVMDGQVTFDDGTKATVHQMAHDVVNFLHWLAEPEMETRKSMGIAVLLFVGILGILMWFAKNAIWKNVK